MAALLLMLLCLVYAPAGVARASSSPWVPPSGGDVAALQEAVSGGVVREVGSIRITSSAVGSHTSIYIAFPCGLTQTDGVPVVLVCGEYLSGAGAGGAPNSTRRALALVTGMVATCGDGSAAPGVAVGTYNSVLQGYPINGVSACGGSGVLLSRDHQGTSWDQGLGYEVRINQGGSVLATCSDGSSLTSVSASGYGSLAVSCPDGMTVVGATVNGSSYEVPGYGSSPNLSVACARGECQPRVTLGGYSCDPTMAVGTDPDWCRRAGNGGSIPAEAGCEWSHPTLGVLTLTRADCASWLEGVAGPPVPEPEEHDSGVIVEWLQRILDAINRVKSSVDAAKDAVVQAGQSIVDAIEDLGDKLDGQDAGSGGNGPGVGPGPGAAPGPSGDPGGLAGKFGPWLDVWGSMTGAGFGGSADDCRGPAMVLTLGDRTHTWYLLDACGARAQLATVSRVVLSVVLVWATIMATIRVLASALGLQLKMGE